MKDILTMHISSYKSEKRKGQNEFCDAGLKWEASNKLFVDREIYRDVWVN